MRAVLPITAVAVLAALTGCSSTSVESTPVAATTPSATPSPTKATIHPATGGTISIEGYCYVDPDGDGEGNRDKVEVLSYKGMWTNGEKVTSCHLDGKLPPEYYQAFLKDAPYDEQQHGPLVGEKFVGILEAAYGAPEDNPDLADQVGRVATMCAMPVEGSSLTNINDWDPAKELPTVQYLCPDHPRMAEWEKSIAASKEWQAERDRAEQERRDGKSLSPGKYLVGTEAQPGRWETYTEKVTDCYWATLDAQGNIIENNFVSVAPKFEIYVPSTAAGFELSGCGMRWVGP